MCVMGKHDHPILILVAGKRPRLSRQNHANMSPTCYSYLSLTCYGEVTEKLVPQNLPDATRGNVTNGQTDRQTDVRVSMVKVSALCDVNRAIKTSSSIAWHDATRPVYCCISAAVDGHEICLPPPAYDL